MTNLNGLLRVLGKRAARVGRAIGLARGRREKIESRRGSREPAPRRAARLDRPSRSCDDLESVVSAMLAQERYALLVRPQLVGNLSETELEQARESLLRHMAIVPTGKVTLGEFDEELLAQFADDDPANHQAVVPVEGFFLDRYPITNGQYHEFVAGGGYAEMSIWDARVWPAVLDFVDTTGQPGPKFWIDGCYAEGEEDHPVVGVSYYEAAAFARWVGKRLPTEPEWVKAACWPVPTGPNEHLQRKFPWGDTMDRGRCNLWSGSTNGTSPVFEFAGGASVGGIHQLIGNVWEWTSGNYGSIGLAGRNLTLPTPMKSIRGGAFDTYFDVQATCQFQSGESPVARKHNIGFRCALGLCDVDTSILHPPSMQPAESSHASEVAP